MVRSPTSDKGYKHRVKDEEDTLLLQRRLCRVCINILGTLHPRVLLKIPGELNLGYEMYFSRHVSCVSV